MLNLRRCIIEYVISGQGSKAIIFMHGWGGGYESFLGAVKAMEKRYMCVNVSFFNELENAPLKLDDYAVFVVKIIENLKSEFSIDKIILVGHSFGGRVAIRLGAKNMADCIILVDSAGLKPRRRLKYYIRRFKARVVKLFKLRIAVGSEDYKLLPPIRKKTFSNIVRTYQDEECKCIHVPCLIIWGQKDKDTPMYMAKKLNRSINDSGLIALKGAGHYSYIDEFEIFISALDNFIRAVL